MAIIREQVIKLHVDSVVVSLVQKGPHFACSKVYNHIEPLFLTLYATPNNVGKILKSVLCNFPFYSMK